MKRTMLIIFFVLFAGFGDVLAEGVKTYEITVACPESSPPFFFRRGDGRLSGIGIGIWRLWAEKTGIGIRFLTGTWEETLNMVRDGTADAHGGLIYSEERDRWLDYAAAVAQTEVNFFFHRDVFGLEKLEDLLGFRIGVVSGSYNEKYVRERLPSAALAPYDTAPLMLDAARKGEIRVFVRSVENSLWCLRSKGLSDTFRFHPDKPLYVRPFFAAVREGDADLAGRIRHGMSLITNEERAAIERKWLGMSEINTPESLVIVMDKDFPPFSFLNSQREPSGILVDTWRLWARKTGQKIEFHVDTWENTLEEIRNGQADIHSGLFSTEVRSEWMAFSQPIHEVGIGMFFPMRQRGATEALAGQRLGILGGTYQEKYLREHYPDSETVPFDTAEGMIMAAKDGRIRAFLSDVVSASAHISRLGLSGDFDGSEKVLYRRTVHAGVRKENKALLDLVDRGLDAISNEELARIERRWISDPDNRCHRPGNAKLRLTAAEETWLVRHKRMLVGSGPAYPPFGFVDEDGAYRGMFADYLAIIAGRMGVSFDFVFLNRPKIPRRIEERGADLFFAKEMLTEDAHIRFTRPVFSSSSVIITRNDFPSVETLGKLGGRKIGVDKDSDLYERLTKKYPDIRVRAFSDAFHALEAVSAGGTDAFVGNLTEAAYLIRKHRLGNLRIAAPAEFEDDDIRIGVRGDWPECLGILNKVLSTITPEEHDLIREKWVSVRYEQKIDWAFFWRWLFMILLVSGTVLGFVFFWNRRLAKEIRERGRAELSLRESEGRYRRLIEKSPNIVYIFSDKRGGVYWSPRVEEILGYSPDDIIENPFLWHDSIHPEDMPRVDQAIEDDKKGRDFDIRYRIKDRSGNWHWFHDRFIGKRRQGDEVIIEGLVTDITEQKIVRDRFEAESLFRKSVIEFATEGICVCHAVEEYPHVRFTVWNERMEEITGYTMEEINRLGWYQTVYPDPEARQRAIERVSRMREGVGLEREERTIIRKDGSARVLSISTTLITSADGTPSVLGMMYDLTERKQAELSMLKAKEEWERTFDAVPDLIMILDKEHRIVRVNKSMSQGVGLAPEACVGQHCHKLLHGTDAPPPFCPHAKLSGDGQSRIAEIPLKYPGGYFLVTVSPLFDRNGNLSGSVHVCRDINERRCMEEDLRKARDAAEAASRAKSEFLARMSHDIRTPMNAVIGLSRLALQTALTEVQRDYLDNIHGSARSLLGLLNDILDFSKIEAGKMGLESSDFRLDDVLGNLSTLIAVMIKEKDIEVVFHVDEAIPRVLIGDAMRLGQILTNLASNAVKFTDRGEIMIRAEIAGEETPAPEKSEIRNPKSEISPQGENTEIPHRGGTKGGVPTENEDLDTIKLRFSVRDTGVGMGPDIIPDIFESFSQADDSTTRRYEGSGLGLAICKRLTGMMGGEIWAESEPGKGSLFCFTAILGWLPEEEEKRFLPPEELRGTRVLVADDSKPFLEFLCQALHSFSFHATCVSSGSAALTELEKNVKEGMPYELLISDWKMPDMDGVEMLRRMRRDLRLARIPAVIMVTAYGREELMGTAKDMDIAAFLIKPVTLSVLFDTIVRVLKEKKGETVSPRAETLGGHRKNESEKLPKGNVLVAEDNAINQLIIRKLLENAGMSVEIAENGREALEALGRSRFDLVIMDIRMPEMDGYEATRKIRSSKSEIRDIPIVALTADAMSGDRKKCLDLGMDDYLSKPVEPKELFSLLSKWMKAEMGENAVPEPEEGGTRFPHILPGFDMETALKSVSGKRSFFAKLLGDFVQDHGDAAETMRELLDRGDAKQARFLAHTVKGVAGGLGARVLHAAAEELERAAAKNRLDRQKILWYNFKNALEQVLASADIVEKAFRQTEAEAACPREKPSSAAPPNIPEAMRFVKTLKGMLEDGNIEAVEFAETRMAGLDALGLEKQRGRLEKQLGNYDFEDALETLGEIKRFLCS